MYHPHTYRCVGTDLSYGEILKHNNLLISNKLKAKQLSILEIDSRHL